jgi:hypothetical protein
MLFQPLKGELRNSKSGVGPATDGVDDDEPIAARSTPPAGDGVVTGKLNVRIGTASNHGTKGAKLFGDDGPSRLTSIDILRRIIAELGARFLYVRRWCLKKKTASQEENWSHVGDFGIFSSSSQREDSERRDKSRQLPFGGSLETGSGDNDAFARAFSGFVFV